jgi:predicted O-linked N-acetylglucosamine transferase (SPINDLY family)
VAVELTRDGARLAELRRTLRGRLKNSPLGDGPGFTRRLEDAYRRMLLDLQQSK